MTPKSIAPERAKRLMFRLLRNCQCIANHVLLASAISLLGFDSWAAPARESGAGPRSMQKRWVVLWRKIDDPKEMDPSIERIPRAAGTRYNNLAFSPNIA